MKCINANALFASYCKNVCGKKYATTTKIDEPCFCSLKEAVDDAGVFLDYTCLSGKWVDDVDEYINLYYEQTKRDVRGNIKEFFTDDHVACSECLYIFDTRHNVVEIFEYCPKCGAKLEWEDVVDA